VAVGLEGADKREDVRRGVCGWWTIVIGNLKEVRVSRGKHEEWWYAVLSNSIDVGWAHNLRGYAFFIYEAAVNPRIRDG
jgi:hypothetical protein